jgi:transcriptional regulator with PAS, ATPase and Fis domain
MKKPYDPVVTAADPRVVPILIRGAILRVTEGPDAGVELRVSGPLASVGTGELCDLQLTDRSISRDHLRLSLSDKGIVLRDDSSRNGTWMDDVRVHHAIITKSTSVRLGSTTIQIELDARVSEIAASNTSRFGGALGAAPAMRVVFAMLQRAAATELTVLLEGESGVGKEVLARAIHETSPRAKEPFITVDCGSIPAHLIESELFGHTRGAFTGASGDRQGLFEEASGGTIFLDEIGELPIELQPKLLRVLEQREVRPVGSNRSRPVDVRVVAATNRQLTASVARGEFREDLM